MKTKFFKPALVLLTFTFYLSIAFGQSPEKMSYQAVIRDASGQLVVNSQIGIQISILRGSSTGTEVYKEVHYPYPQTNANGLVSIEIGRGIPLTGVFAEINWSNGPFYIMTETDPAGGMNYSITATSQLLSVPYALHAKTADSLRGGVIESDPVYSSSVAAGISGADTAGWSLAFSWGDHAQQGYLTQELQVLSISNDTIFLTGGSFAVIPPRFSGNYHDLSNKPNISDSITTYGFSGNYNDLSNRPVTATTTTDGYMSHTDKTKLDSLQNASIIAATGISVSGTYPNISIATTSPTYTIGLNNELGGYVFYVTPDSKHGLVAATQDQSTSSTWLNAINIISNPANHDTAGRRFTDWRLPTLYELTLMYYQRANIGGFGNVFYWSSTEASSSHANGFWFSLGYQDNFGKIHSTSIRAVRAF